MSSFRAFQRHLQERLHHQGLRTAELVLLIKSPIAQSPSAKVQNPAREAKGGITCEGRKRYKVHNRQDTRLRHLSPTLTLWSQTVPGECHRITIFLVAATNALSPPLLPFLSMYFHVCSTLGSCTKAHLHNHLRNALSSQCFAANKALSLDTCQCIE